MIQQRKPTAPLAACTGCHKRRAHSAAGHAAAGRYYGERGLRPVTRECRPQSNAERLARYYAHPVAIKRRPLPNLDWRKAARA